MTLPPHIKKRDLALSHVCIASSKLYEPNEYHNFVFKPKSFLEGKSRETFNFIFFIKP